MSERGLDADLGLARLGAVVASPFRQNFRQSLSPLSLSTLQNTLSLIQQHSTSGSQSALTSHHHHPLIIRSLRQKEEFDDHYPGRGKIMSHYGGGYGGGYGGSKGGGGYSNGYTNGYDDHGRRDYGSRDYYSSG